jgi:hypothetical protein
VIYFTTLDKPMVLNTTNKNLLVEKLGKVPASWLGRKRRPLVGLPPVGIVHDTLS